MEGLFAMALLNAKTLRDVRKCVEKYCANYAGGVCILHESPCDYYGKYGHSVSCDYFEQVVLPNEPLLQKAYEEAHGIINAEKEAVKYNVGKCAKCGEAFIKRSNRAKYCGACRAVKQREHNRNYMRKKRSS
jgi:Cysteine-rich VLP